LPDPEPVLSFPRGTPFEWVIAIGVCVLLFVIAVFVDSRRRRKQSAHHVQSQWDAIGRIAKEKELGEEDAAMLTDLIRRWSPQQPLMAATVREHFNECIDKEMQRLRNDRAAMEAAGVRLRDIRAKLALDYVPLGQRINNTRDMFTGQTIWMATKAGEKVRWYRFQVTDVNEACFLAALHEEQPETPNFEPHTELRCRMWREDDARYVFVVFFVRIDEDSKLYVFEHTSQLDRLQAREHFRVRLDHNVTVGVLNAPVDDNLEDVHSRRAVTKIRGRLTSLSAGGCALVLPQAVPKQVLLRVLLELPGAPAIEVEASIVGATPISGGRHLVRVQFVAMSNEVNDALTRYVMRRQQPQLETEAEQTPV
jgi:c-di-GMP-binding flagellar brake protein YcgR